MPYFVSIQINVVWCTCLFYEIYPHYITNTHIVTPILHVEAIYIWHMFKSHWDVSIYFDFVYTSSTYIIIVLFTYLPPVPLHNFFKDDLSSRTWADCCYIIWMIKIKVSSAIRSRLIPVFVLFSSLHTLHGSDGSICVPRSAGKLFQTLRRLIFVILWYGLYLSRSLRTYYTSRSTSVWTQLS